MALTLEDIEALLGLERDPVWVGELPYEVANRLGIKNPSVYLSIERIWHIFERHPDITKFDLLHLPFVIRNGFLLREKEKQNCLIANYQIPDDRRRVIAPLKIANQECEIWVS
jgi:hypothetical protein